MSVPLSRNRDFVLLWSGLTVSELGTATTTIATPLLILAMTQSAVTAGLVATISAIAATAMRLPAGALADRFDRRRLLIITAVVRLFVALILATSIAVSASPVWLVAILITIIAAGGAVSQPAEMSAVSQVVPADQLPTAYAGNEGRSYAAALVGPALGGIFYGLGRAIPFWFDAASYAFALVTAALIRADLRPQRPEAVPSDGSAPERDGFARGIVEGLRAVLADPFLRAVVVVAPLVNFALTGAVFALTVVLRQAGVDAGLIGAANAVFAIGGLLGALLAPRLMARVSITPLIRLVIVASTASLAVEAAFAGSLIMAIPLVVAALFAPAFNAALFTRIGIEVPARMQGRVLSVVILLATASAALAPAVTGLLIHSTSGSIAIGFLAVLLALAGIASFMLRGLRPVTQISDEEP